MNLRIRLLAVLSMLSLPAAGQTVTTRLLDAGTGGFTGGFPSMATVNGCPAVAYYNFTDNNLMFARNSAADGAGTWTVTTVDRSEEAGDYCSLAVINGLPAISYYDKSEGVVKYVRALDANGTAWRPPLTIDTVGSGGGQTSLAVVNGHPAISYYLFSSGGFNGDLKYVRASDASGTSWGAPVNLTSDRGGIWGEHSSLAVINGRPAISFYQSSDGNLAYVRALDADGVSWGTLLTLDVSGIVGKYSSLQTVNGRPAISYEDETNGDLKYVRALDAAGATWGAPLTLDSAGSTGRYSSLKVIQGQPAISYGDVTNGDLKWVRALDPDGGTWGLPQTIDSNGGGYTSLAVVDGNPAISHYGTGGLRYVRATAVDGATWNASSPVDSGVESGVTGQYTSQIIVNGNPAVSYVDTTNKALKYVRAQNSGGTAWSAPVTVVSSGTVIAYTTLRVVNGNPAISYYDDTNDDLVFVRALDVNGTSWGAPVVVVSTGNVGSHSSMAVVGGRPAISYYDGTSADLKYVRATNASGTSWGTPVTLDSTGTVGQYSSLAVVNGNPAVSYYYTSNLLFRYIRATDATGTTWGAPVDLSGIATGGSFTTLAVINGNPAVGFYSMTPGGLRYRRAQDANGTTWGTEVNLGDHAENPSLAVVNGHPALSYRNGTNLSDLKYVRALDTSGTTWGSPIILDSAGNTGLYTSMLEINGEPCISYYDGTNGDLRWAAYGVPEPDATGPLGGLMTLSPASPVNPGAALTVTFSDWHDPSTPLSYAVLFDNVVVSPQGSTASRNLTAPTTPGTYTLKGRIYDALGNLTEITQSFSVNTPAQQQAAAVIAAAGLTGPAAALDAVPFNDGVPNLLKYAFNMDLSGPDGHQMITAGVSGLPEVTFPLGTIRLEFVRRIGNGLVYTPMISATLAPGSWVPCTVTPMVSPIDATWERVVYDQPYDTFFYPQCFGVVDVTLP